MKNKYKNLKKALKTLFLATALAGSGIIASQILILINKEQQKPVEIKKVIINPKTAKLIQIENNLAKKVNNKKLMQNLEITEDNLFAFNNLEINHNFGEWLNTDEMKQVLKYTKTIGDNAFYSNVKETKINLPLCTSIGKNAFYSNKALETIDAPELNSIKDNAFYSNKALTRNFFSKINFNRQ